MPAPAFDLQFYLKKTPAHDFSYEIYKIFKNTYFVEHLRTTAFVNCQYCSENELIENFFK